MKKGYPVFLMVMMLVMLIGMMGMPAPAPVLAQAGADCTPDPAGGCITPEPTDRVIVAPPTETLPVIADRATPTATATPPSFTLPQPPEENPFRPTPFGFEARPSPTAMPPLAIPPNPDLDLEVWAVEVTQGLQDLENRMPLVAERGTVIRVYVRSNSGATIYGVRGALQITQEGSPAGIVYASNQPIAAFADGGNRLDVDATLNFYVPIDTRVGKVTYKAFAYPVNPQFPYQYEKDAQNNFFEVDVEYEEGVNVTVVMPSIHMHAYDEDEIFLDQVKDYVFDTNAARIGMDLMRFYPVADVTVVSDIVKIYPSDHAPNKHINDWSLINNLPAADQILAKIQSYKDDANGAYFGDFWYGMLDPTLPWWWDLEGGGIFEATGQSNGTVAMGLMLTNFNPSFPWWVEGGITGAHEGGHNYGLGHYFCAGNEGLGGDIDPNYPFPEQVTDADKDGKDDEVNCSLAAVDPKGFYGFDWYYHLWPHLSEPTVISNDPAEAAPNRGFPLMGYRQPQYTDVYTYCFLLNQFGIACDLADLGVAYIPDNLKLANLSLLPLSHEDGGKFPEYLENAEAFLRVYGVIDSGTNTASFVEVAREEELSESLVATVTERAGDVAHVIEEGQVTPYTLTLDDSGGQSLFSLPLYDLGTLHEVSTSQSVSEVVPFIEGARFIRIRNGDTILTERRVSNNPPKVTVTTQNSGGVVEAPEVISWQGVDPDGDSLTYMLQYSPDAGQSWFPVLKELRVTSINLESFAGLPGSDKGLFRITANDGVYTGYDDNDAFISLPDNSPSALIYSPVEGAVYPDGGTMYLTGQAFDPEDGNLEGASLVWTSDIDGLIGRGKEALTYTLSPGIHKISLAATDSKGHLDETFVYIKVDGDYQRAVPTDEEIQTVAAIFNGDIPSRVEGDAVVPPTALAAPTQPESALPAASSEGSLLPSIVLGVLTVLIVVIAVVFVARRKQK